MGAEQGKPERTEEAERRRKGRKAERAKQTYDDLRNDWSQDQSDEKIKLIRA